MCGRSSGLCFIRLQFLAPEQHRGWGDKVPNTLLPFWGLRAGKINTGDHKGTILTFNKTAVYDGTTPWKEFLHRFESCAKANCWSENTMAVHLKFCLVGAAGAIVHRNPRSSQWDYSRLVEEMETAYGPSSEHAAAVAIELRQRVRKLGSFICHQPQAHNMAERRPRAAVMREGAEEEQAETAAAFPAARWKPKPCGPSPHLQHAGPNPNYTPHKRGGRKDIKWEEIRCHNCSGLGHMKRNCASPKKVFITQASTVSPETPDPAVLHLKAQDQEMSIHMLVHELDVCAVLDSGARKSVLPLRHYNAIHPDVRPPLQPSRVETLLGVGPGDVPVLGEARIPVQINNCQVAYLGHIVLEDGVATDPSKVRKVPEWPSPTSIQEVRQFIGLASYYRRFVRDFASIAEPLHALTKKHARFQWTEKCQAAFNKLKRLLTTAPVLGYPLDQGNMILDTDASDVGIGAVLSQVQQGSERVLAYGSHKLSKTEQNYCTTRRELLAVVEFTSHFRQYLLGRPSIVRTDHSSLRWLTKMKEPEGQLARWLERLGEYNFEIIHRPGHLHSNADSLSRRPCRQSCSCKLPGPSLHPANVSHQAVQCELDSDINKMMLSPVEVEGHSASTAVSLVGVDEASPADTDSLKPPERIYWTETTNAELFGGWSPEELRQAQKADPDIAPIRAWMEASAERPPWVTVSPCSPATKTYWSQWKRLYIRDEILVRRFFCLDDTQFYPQVVLPRAFRPDVMRQMHEGQVGGHFGVERTVARLQTRYFWYRMKEDVALWCGTCTSCASKARPRKTPQAPMGTVQVGAPMERITLDIMGPLNETERNNCYVLVIQDYFTKWVEAFPLPNERAVTVASEWVCRYGAPQTLHSDQGRNFESEVFQKMCTLFGIEKTHTTPFRPQSDGQVERFNATLQKIRATTAERCHWDWDLMIPYAVMAYRATKHSATGFTPHFMMFGREVSEPVDLVAGLHLDADTAPSAPEYVQHTRERLELAHRIARDALSTRRVSNKVRKFLPSYEGPYFVLGHLDDLVCRIQKGPKTKVKVVHHDQLKPYRCRDPLDNTWVMEQARSWTPVEVSPPALIVDLADPPLGLSQLFSDADTEETSSCASSDPAVGIPAATISLPSTSSPLDSATPGESQDSGGGVAEQQHQSQRSQRPSRQRRSPARYGEWVDH
ncbi:hypothetical protein SKAU_G00281610 [Synaphobranchus kaupii]|uniref:Gypsy retrotransposon integrase-like protein 1 n=1 Tax=Synaphobranchus kaupii TaxID=118154 RepID=A0A9Q1EX96_SYNKA|nr:hypothetical protein SKAU_G00281610 [Synaphobranchus kaupii]